MGLEKKFRHNATLRVDNPLHLRFRQQPTSNSMRLFSFLSLTYFLVLAIEIYAEMMDDLEMVWVTKPLLMPILLIIFLSQGWQNPPKERLFFIAALIFSLGGDVFLMFKREDLFVFGLASFLLGHLAYILSFSGRIKDARVSATEKLLTAIPFVGFVLGFLWFLYPYISADPKTQPLFAPVAVYASVIALMGFTSLLRRKGVPAQGFQLVFGGAMLFIISDCCIAINKFVEPLSQPGLVIMATYGLAQYLMTLGTLKSNKA